MFRNSCAARTGNNDSPQITGRKQWAFCLPAASDNTAADAQTEKLWSTAEPLGTFLKLTAAWAAQHHVELLVTDWAGEQNTWADELSRGKLGRFQHRTAERVSIGWLAPVLRCLGVHYIAPARGSICLGPASTSRPIDERGHNTTGLLEPEEGGIWVSVSAMHSIDLGHPDSSNPVETRVFALRALLAVL